MSEEKNGEEEVVLKAFRTDKKVKIQLTEDGDPQTFKVVTMTGAEKTAWQNSNVDRVKYDGSGKPVGVKKYDGMESGLIATCLRDEFDKPVPRQTIETWSSPVLVFLGKLCLEHNGLTEKSEEEKKG
jgi:hypothetical protein